MSTFLYEVLVRGNPDGTLNGSHQCVGTLYEDGNVVVGLPTPLDPAAVASLLGTSFPDLAAQIGALQAKVTALQARLPPGG